MEEKNSEANEIRWHRWFGDSLKEILSPLGITVHTGFPIMTDPPEADIVILRKPDPSWTPEQLRFMPDGLRQCKAQHILIEFKYTESLNDLIF